MIHQVKRLTKMVPTVRVSMTKTCAHCNMVIDSESEDDYYRCMSLRHAHNLTVCDNYGVSDKCSVYNDMKKIRKTYIISNVNDTKKQ